MFIAENNDLKVVYFELEVEVLRIGSPSPCILCGEVLLIGSRSTSKYFEALRIQNTLKSLLQSSDIAHESFESSSGTV
jgi:hypothetical protein